MIRLSRSSAILACLLALSQGAIAQSLPAYAPINPVAASRSGVYFQPYRLPRPGRWTGSISLDYGTSAELNDVALAAYTLDAELLRLRLGVARDLGPSTFLLADAEVDGAYDGFLDGFLDWYHRTLGFRVRQRDQLPKDEFRYELLLPNGRTFSRKPTDLALGDVRVGAGYRVGRSLQTVLSVTLPTSTGPRGYGRGTVSLNLLNTARFQPHPRLVAEGGFGIGYTPSHGDLEEVQRETFVSLSGGGRYRFWGRQSLYANLIYHSPYYRNTSLPALDRRELTLDFGWILTTRGGDWRIGLTEDLEPGGPAIDLVFRFGRDF
ncbi:MAG TPA: DUF3187 family protein [Gemmatimonadales bacterium]